MRSGLSMRRASGSYWPRPRTRSSDANSPPRRCRMGEPEARIVAEADAAIGAAARHEMSVDEAYVLVGHGFTTVKRELAALRGEVRRLSDENEHWQDNIHAMVRAG